MHNGIITNAQTLRSLLERKGYQFVSETDTESIAVMCQFVYDEHCKVVTLNKKKRRHSLLRNSQTVLSSECGWSQTRLFDSCRGSYFSTRRVVRPGVQVSALPRHGTSDFRFRSQLIFPRALIPHLFSVGNCHQERISAPNRSQR